MLLVQEQRLTTPLLYLSGYLEAHRRQYYDRLQAVRERGEIQEWLQFFLTAVRRQAEDAVSRASQLIRLRETFQQTANVSKSRLSALIPLVFANPFLTVRRVERATGLTNQGARNLIRAAERQGWCESIGSIGQGGRAYWVARDVWLITEANPTYE